jgi:hypothetical protein
MTNQVRDALTASAATALDAGLLKVELASVVRYLAHNAHVEVTAADVGCVCERAAPSRRLRASAPPADPGALGSDHERPPRHVLLIAQSGMMSGRESGSAPCI